MASARSWDCEPVSPSRGKPTSSATPAQQDAAIAAMIAGRSARALIWVSELRALIRRAAPDASERGIPGWRIVAYEAPRIFAYLVPLADSVALGLQIRAIDRERLGSCLGKLSADSLARLEQAILTVLDLER